VPLGEDLARLRLAAGKSGIPGRRPGPSQGGATISEDEDDRQVERQIHAGEQALRRVVDSGQDPATVVFKRTDRRDEYVQFYLHDHLFHGEVGSREWGSDGRPLPPQAVERLAALGFLQTDANPNYVRDGLPPDPKALAQLTLDLFRHAYDVPEGLVLRVSVNLDPEAHTRSAEERAEESLRRGDSENSSNPGRRYCHRDTSAESMTWRTSRSGSGFRPTGGVCRSRLRAGSVGTWRGTTALLPKRLQLVPVQVGRSS